MGIHVEPLAREPSVHMPMALSPKKGVQTLVTGGQPGCREQGGDLPGTHRKAAELAVGQPRECLPASQPHTHRDKGPLCGQEAGAGLVPELRQDPGPSCQPCSSGAAQGLGVQEDTQGGRQCQDGATQGSSMLAGPLYLGGTQDLGAGWPQLPPGLLQRPLS